MTEEIVHALANELSRRRLKIVFAESCTGGLVSAVLAGVPGISEWLCGSAVTYRCNTKVAWLGVSASEIDLHTAVSREVAQQMATGVLEKTPEADLALSITGHLGPNAPQGFDGLVFVGVGIRLEQRILESEVVRHELEAVERGARQREAAGFVMQIALDRIEDSRHGCGQN